MPGPGDAKWPGEDSVEEFYSPECFRVHAIYADWLAAIEAGTAIYRLPDPQGRTWTDEALTAFLDELDSYVGNTAQVTYANNNRRKGGPEFDAGPGFLRLVYEQRLAMAQDLAAALDETPTPAPLSGMESFC